MHPVRIREIQEFLERWQQSSLAGAHPLYTGYLRSLAEDQRLPAVEQYLRPFIAQLAPRPHDERYAFINAACECVDWRNHRAGSSRVPGLPYELMERVVIPTLYEQRRLQPEDARVHAWMALLPVPEVGVSLPNSRELLQEAHRLVPGDLFVIERLAENWLDGVAFACHHLPEALLYPVEEVMRDLQEVRRLALLLPEGPRANIERIANGCDQEIQAFVAQRP